MNAIWYRKNPLCYLLFPLSLIYRAIIFIRKCFYQIKLFKSYRAPVPIIVVGNITVGGTGKTPLVIAIINALKKNGFHPGIITRGYGGQSKTWPQSVTENSDPILVGDEAVLLSRNAKVPVIAGPKRTDNIKKLLAEFSCNVIVSDDGLQHYAMARDIEIAVIDSTRRFGNGFCLPAGPLREPVLRLNTVDFIVSNGAASTNEYKMEFVIDEIINKNSTSLSVANAKNITAIAAIGNPDRFFTSLKQLNIQFETRIFRDHYQFKKSDFDFLKKEDVVVMTEKDAVKCRAFSDDRFYYARGHVEIDPRVMTEIMSRIPFVP